MNNKVDLVDIRNDQYYRYICNIDNIQPNIMTYFDIQKVKKIKNIMIWSPVAVCFAVALANMVYSFLLGYPQVILFKNFFLALLFSLLVLCCLIVPLMLLIHPTTDKKCHLISRWFDVFKKEYQPSKSMSDSALERFFLKSLDIIFTDKEKSARFLQVVQIDEKPYSALCQVFKKDWDEIIENDKLKELNQLKAATLDILSHLFSDNVEHENNLMAEYRLFIGEIDNIEQMQKQQKFLKDCVLDKLSGESIDYYAILTTAKSQYKSLS